MDLKILYDSLNCFVFSFQLIELPYFQERTKSRCKQIGAFIHLHNIAVYVIRDSNEVPWKVKGN